RWRAVVFRSSPLLPASPVAGGAGGGTPEVAPTPVVGGGDCLPPPPSLSLSSSSLPRCPCFPNWVLCFARLR
ncbi:hypothetical protein U1Q18_026091, partial [Sarracenia purpurea var. burkii]